MLTSSWPKDQPWLTTILRTTVVVLEWVIITWGEEGCKGEEWVKDGDANGSTSVRSAHKGESNKETVGFDGENY